MGFRAAAALLPRSNRLLLPGKIAPLCACIDECNAEVRRRDIAFPISDEADLEMRPPLRQAALAARNTYWLLLALRRSPIILFFAAFSAS